MLHRRRAVIAAVLTTLVVASGCSSSTKAATGSSNTYTVGVLTDLTGPGSNTGVTFEPGVKAGIGLAAGQGYHIKYVMADTGTSPSGAQAAAQKLVEQDHVFAVLMASVVGFGAANYLAAHNIPVVGAAVDGPEWISDRNMFSTLGTQDYTKVQTTFGKLLKMLGVTVIGAVGYGIEPSSAEVAKGYAASAHLEGIKTGYINANFPFGSTNVEPMAIAMKNAGVDGLATAIVTNSSFAIVEALDQLGVHLKAAVLPTGYGGDLAGGGAGAERAAQGLYFSVGYEPVELHSAATERFQNALAKYANVTTEPTLSEYLGYTAVDALVTGLKAAGKQPTPASFSSAMLSITHYDAAGLFGGHSIGFSMSQRGQTAGADNCTWFVRYSGTAFHMVPGADPVCGTTAAGVKVSASS